MTSSKATAFERSNVNAERPGNREICSSRNKIGWSERSSTNNDAMQEQSDINGKNMSPPRLIRCHLAVPIPKILANPQTTELWRR
jgi:hypothetical protein